MNTSKMLAVVAAFLLTASPANAQDVIFDNGSYDPGEYAWNGAVPYRLADDFELDNNGKTIGQIVWWGYFNEATPSQTFSIQIVEDDEGSPASGPVLFSYSGSVSAFNTAHPPIRKHDLTIEPVELEAQTRYWLIIQYLQNEGGPGAWNWQTASDSGNAKQDTSNGSGWVLPEGDETAVAFQLLGPPPGVNLVSGRETEPVGTVTVTDNDGMLAVNFAPSAPLRIFEAHAAAGVIEEGYCDVPQNRKGNPRVGKFEGQQEVGVPGASKLTVNVPDVFEDGATICIAAHAVVYDPTLAGDDPDNQTGCDFNGDDEVSEDEAFACSEEGAWGDGMEFDGKSWATWFEFKTDEVEPTLSCPCWSNYTEPGLVSLLNGFEWTRPECSVSLPELYAFDDGLDFGLEVSSYEEFAVCNLVLEDQSQVLNQNLTAQELSTCVSEAQSIIPKLTAACRDPSDYRLKRDITELVELDNGIKLYSFKYLWSGETYVGVMAQDLLLDRHHHGAVKVMDNAYFAVDYASLGLRMVTLAEWEDSADSIYFNQQTKSRASL